MLRSNHSSKTPGTIAFLPSPSVLMDLHLLNRPWISPTM